jgi:hypothetical protein
LERLKLRLWGAGCVRHFLVAHPVSAADVEEFVGTGLRKAEELAEMALYARVLPATHYGSSSGDRVTFVCHPSVYNALMAEPLMAVESDDYTRGKWDFRVSCDARLLGGVDRLVIYAIGQCLRHPGPEVVQGLWGALGLLEARASGQRLAFEQLAADGFAWPNDLQIGPLLAWNDGLVRTMAEQIYKDRRWGDMPVLADALEDAGCQDQRLLRHCRADRPHARGCWALDALMGRPRPNLNFTGDWEALT